MQRPWKRAAVWLAFIGPFFFASYGFANWLAARSAHVGAIVFPWEHSIPFLPWTIVPYWSIDVLYCVSLFVCTTSRELDRHAQRLLLIQLVCVTCFIAFPLRFSFDKPATTGLSGALFTALGTFDKPFNQAPSLHIALLVAIWARLAAHLRRFRWALHVWMLLIAVSILTTWQHHFIDLPTGFAVGFAALWLLPDDAPVFAAAKLTNDPARRRIAAIYAAGAIAFAALAWLGGTFLWLFSVSIAFVVVALNYALFGAHGFQKNGDGRLSGGSLGLLAPYVAGAWINSRLWTRRHPSPAEVADGVWIGRIPTRWEVANFQAIVDVAAELPCGTTAGIAYKAVPMLDMVVPAADELTAAAALIEEMRRRGRVLVCCALGYSRSAAAVAAWLRITKRASSADAAMMMVRKARPAVVLKSKHAAALEFLG